MTGEWFSSGTQVSYINKTDIHDITEILLKVSLNAITHNPNQARVDKMLTLLMNILISAKENGWKILLCKGNKHSETPPFFFSGTVP